MKLSSIYIVSWFGNRDDEALRSRRKEIHEKQVEWAKGHDLTVVVYAQDYDKDEYLSGVTYIKNKGKVLPPGHARNFLLKRFYKTDDDFAIFADNDAVLYELPQHKDSIDFIERFRTFDVEDFRDVGIVLPLDPARSAFRQEVNRDAYDRAYTFRRTSRVKGSFMLLKNLRKHAKMKPLFDETTFGYRDGKLLPGEDSDFAYTLWQAGHGSYVTAHAILNEFGRGRSTWTDSDVERYDQHIEFFVPAMNKKHGKIFYTAPTANTSGFSFFGISTHEDCGPKLRFARDGVDRTKTLIRYGHTDIEFRPLPEPMTVPEAVPYMEKSDLYDNNPHFRDAVDVLSGRRIPKRSIKQYSTKQKTFTNWPVLNPKDLPSKIEILK